jgi:hypothetical protein
MSDLFEGAFAAGAYAGDPDAAPLPYDARRGTPDDVDDPDAEGGIDELGDDLDDEFDDIDDLEDEDDEDDDLEDEDDEEDDDDLDDDEDDLDDEDLDEDEAEDAGYDEDEEA